MSIAEVFITTNEALKVLGMKEVIIDYKEPGKPHGATIPEYIITIVDVPDWARNEKITEIMIKYLKGEVFHQDTYRNITLCTKEHDRMKFVCYEQGKPKVRKE
jgi:hypothetical protein